jgi:heptosyltransferase-1
VSLSSRFASSAASDAVSDDWRPPIRRLLIVRLGAMGDVIHGLYAVTALRRAFPETTIGWLVEERWAELLCTLPAPRYGPRSAQRPLVDRVHTVDTRKWRRAPFTAATWERVAATLSDLRAAHYEVAVDLQGAVRSSLLAKLSGAPVIYGAAQPRENLATMFYTRKVIARGRHVIEQNLSLAEAVAEQRLRTPEIALPRDPAADQEIERMLNTRGNRQFAVINPGAGWGSKQWPPERYQEVARQLVTHGLKVVINVGPGEESLAQAIKAGSDVEIFSGSLTQLIALTRRARLFIGGDTGPMHLAAALGVPIVAIFGPTDPARNGPFSVGSVVLRSPSSTNSYHHVSQPDAGLLEINAAQVIAAARQLLQERHG